MGERIYNGLMDWIVDREAKRIRGSFINFMGWLLFSTIMILMCFLVAHEVLNHEEKLSVLTNLILGMFGFFTAGYTAITAFYMNNKIKRELGSPKPFRSYAAASNPECSDDPMDRDKLKSRDSD